MDTLPNLQKVDAEDHQNLAEHGHDLIICPSSRVFHVGAWEPGRCQAPNIFGKTGGPRERLRRDTRAAMALPSAAAIIIYLAREWTSGSTNSKEMTVGENLPSRLIFSSDSPVPRARVTSLSSSITNVEPTS